MKFEEPPAPFKIRTTISNATFELELNSWTHNQVQFVCELCILISEILANVRSINSKNKCLLWTRSNSYISHLRNDSFMVSLHLVELFVVFLDDFILNWALCKAGSIIWSKPSHRCSSWAFQSQTPSAASHFSAIQLHYWFYPELVCAHGFWSPVAFWSYCSHSSIWWRNQLCLNYIYII